MNDNSDKEQQQPAVNDEERLRMLGYDAKLGRPLGFWSSAAMNFCHLGWTFELGALSIMYSWKGPLLFVIGYPCAAILHLILLGPFSEMASAYPVAGAMASWAWKFARAGVGYECQWGWFVSGIVLTAHMGKILLYLYNVSAFVAQLYILAADIPMTPDGSVALDPKLWWNPTFDAAIITIISVLLISRTARSPKFWVTMGTLNLVLGLTIVALLITAMVKTRHLPKHTGFPTRDSWTGSFSFTIFMGLPMKTTALDCPAHMSEETVEPARNVPRSMWSSTVTHFILTYTIGCLYIFGCVPAAGEAAGENPVFAMQTAADLGDILTLVISLLFIICCIIQLQANVVVTSRFIFAMARDRALPCGDWLELTSKDKEPWVADLAIICAMYISVVSWFVPQSFNYNLIQSGYWFMSVAYIVPFGLYLFANVDLQQERSHFSLRKWSKPMAALAMVWMVIPVIQGCVPISFWNVLVTNKIKNGTISAFPFVFLFVFALLLVSWLWIGHLYLGPIRALTIWTAGVEINPRDFGTASQPRRNLLSSMFSWRKGSALSSRTSGSGSRSDPSKRSDPIQEGEGLALNPVAADSHSPRSPIAMIPGLPSPGPSTAGSASPRSTGFPMHSSFFGQQDSQRAPTYPTNQIESQLLPGESHVAWGTQSRVQWAQQRSFAPAQDESQIEGTRSIMTLGEMTRGEMAMTESELDPTATMHQGGSLSWSGGRLPPPPRR